MGVLYWMKGKIIDCKPKKKKVGKFFTPRQLCVALCVCVRSISPLWMQSGRFSMTSWTRFPRVVPRWCCPNCPLVMSPHSTLQTGEIFVFYRLCYLSDCLWLGLGINRWKMYAALMYVQCGNTFVSLLLHRNAKRPGSHAVWNFMWQCFCAVWIVVMQKLGLGKKNCSCLKYVWWNVVLHCSVLYKLWFGTDMFCAIWIVLAKTCFVLYELWFCRDIFCALWIRFCSWHVLCCMNCHFAVTFCMDTLNSTQTVILQGHVLCWTCAGGGSETHHEGLWRFHSDHCAEFDTWCPRHLRTVWGGAVRRWKVCR